MKNQNKFQIGIERLSKAGNDPDFLGMALISLHGALEDYFRDWLSSNSSVPPSIREIVIDTRKTHWKGLLDLMQQYGGLKDHQRNYIFHINKLRRNVGHGGRYTGTRFELEKYADFVRGFVASESSSTSKNQNNNVRQKGDDLRLDLKLEFREAIFGVEKQIRIPHLETCQVCNRNAAKLRTSANTCSVCNGAGRKQETKNLKITIPPGVDNGTRIRVAGEGDAGLYGGLVGDLYVYPFVEEDPLLKRDGINIFSEVEITPQEANTGCTKIIDTVNSSGKLNIPPKTKNGVFLRLKNRGVPELGNPENRGDHLIKVKINPSFLEQNVYSNKYIKDDSNYNTTFKKNKSYRKSSILIEIKYIFKIISKFITKIKEQVIKLFIFIFKS